MRIVFVVISGDLVSVYTSLGYHHAVSDVQFHPLDHIIAFCSFGDSHPVLAYHYDPKGLLCSCLLGRTVLFSMTVIRQEANLKVIQERNKVLGI